MTPRTHAIVVALLAGSLMAALPAGPAPAQGLNLGNVVEGLAREAIREGIREGIRNQNRSGEPRQSAPQPPAPSHRVDVRRIQQRLAQLGYSPGVADGLMGPNTRDAIRAFQRDQGYAVTGRASAALLTRLESASARPARQAQAETPRPSFDCARAGTATERAICGSVALADRDRRLTEAFTRALDRSSDPERLRSAQRSWLDRRNACGGDTACLARVMESRIATLGGRPVGGARTVGMQEAPAFGNSTLARFSENVYLVSFPGLIKDRSDSSVFPACIDPADASTLQPAIERATSRRVNIANRDFGDRDFYQLLLSNGDNSYGLIAGRCLQRLMYAQERGDLDRELRFVPIAQGTGAAPSVGASTQVEQPAALATAGSADKPVLRMWLPHYLANVSGEEQLEALTAHIRQLRDRHEFGATALFAENEVRDRQPEFLARQSLDRWRSVLREASLAPPITLRVSAEFRNYKYDFDRGALVFQHYYLKETGEQQQLTRVPAFSGAFEEVTKGDGAGLFGVRGPARTDLALDRQLLAPIIPMGPGRAEELESNRPVIFFDIPLRVTDVGYRETGRGGHGATVSAEVLGMTLTTDVGEQLAAYAPEDMPRVAPEPTPEQEAEPDHERIRLARPRDILAAVARETGRRPIDVIRAAYPASSQNAFERRDEIEAMAADTAEIDLGGFWMQGHGRFADYDYETDRFGFDDLSLRYPEDVSGNEDRIKRYDLFRLSNVGQDGVRFPMPEAEARALDKAAGSSDARFRVRIVAEPATEEGNGLPMEARVAEIVVLRPDSDPAVLDPEAILARINLVPDEAAGTPDRTTQTGPATDDGSGTGFDILGARTGQALDTALAALEEDFITERTLLGKREVWMEAGTGPNVEATTPLREARILVREGGRDFLALFHEPILPENPVTGLARTLTFHEGQRPAPAAIRALLIDKYGELSSEGEHTLTWLRQAPVRPPETSGEMTVGEMVQQSTNQQMQKTNAFRCRKNIEARVMSFGHRVSTALRTGHPAFGRAYDLVNDSGETAPYPSSSPLWPFRSSDFTSEDCDMSLAIAVIELDSDGLVAALRVLVTNPAYPAAIEETAKETLTAETEAQAPAVPDIDL